MGLDIGKWAEKKNKMKGAFNVKIGTSILILITTLFASAGAVAKSNEQQVFNSAYHAKDVLFTDEKRNRKIPVRIYSKALDSCVEQCQTAIVNAGYGISHESYEFVVEALLQHDYLVVAIRHELAGDPPISVAGDLYETRAENWQRGSDTVSFVINEVANLISIKQSELLLVGHSNGGDIAAWYVAENPEQVSGLITLDHRRVPLPRTRTSFMFSLRASDFKADEGVLPTSKEQRHFGDCVVQIPNARHNDIHDGGPDWLKNTINQSIKSFLDGESCNNLREAI